MKIIIKLTLLIILFSISSFAQTFKLTGFVKDKSNNHELAYANIRIKDSYKGTASNSKGKFELNLEKGNYTLISSYLGYRSDSINIRVSKNGIVNFTLSPINLNLPEVTLEQIRNPAYDIIREAVKTKKKIKEQINSFKYSAYTKGLLKTTRDFSNGNFSLSTQDTGKLKITGILENESRGFFKKPLIIRMYYQQ